MEVTPRHQCLIYDGSPAKQLPALTALILRRLRENWRCVYLNSAPMIAGIRSYLAASGLDVARTVDSGALVLSSAQDHLVRGCFDKARMLGILTDTVHQARQDGYANLLVTGDMSWEFGNQRDFAELLEYEYGLERLFERYPSLHGICQYHRDTLPPEATVKALHGHQAVWLNETLSRLNPWYAPPDQPAYQRPKPAASQVEKLISLG